MTFLPKLLYAAIFIFVVFGLAVLGVGGENKTANQSLAAGGGNRLGRFDHESERQTSQGDDGAYKIELVKYSQIHNFDESLAYRKLVHQQISAIPNPQYNPGLLTMSTPWKIGTTKVAKNSSPMLPNNSESLSNWANVHEVDVNIKEKGSISAGWLSMLAPRAYAAETVSAKPIPLSLYQPLAGQIMFKQALEKIPVEQRTPERIAELITGISQLLSSLPAKGEIFLSGGKFSGLTGTRGILAGKVVKGTYRIKIDPVEGIDLIVPAAIEAGLHGPETVMIGLTPGKGKVRTAGEIGGLQKVWQMIWKTDRKESQVLGTRVQSEIRDALPTAPLTIQLFRDENKNGVYDSGESLVEWAGVKMDLEPTTQSSSYNLTEGWNLIAFPVVPTSVATAAEAVQDIAKEGGYVTTISTWEGDKWIEYSQRGLEKFGHDFALVPGRAYFLESQLNSVWTVAGTPLPAENQAIQLRKGWNGVGIPKEGATAVQILDDLQAIGEGSQTSPCEVCETAEQAAKWNFGLWDVVVKRRYSAEHHEVYGRDFPIKPGEGYFIHASEDAIWTMDDRR